MKALHVVIDGLTYLSMQVPINGFVKIIGALSTASRQMSLDSTHPNLRTWKLGAMLILNLLYLLLGLGLFHLKAMPTA